MTILGKKLRDISTIGIADIISSGLSAIFWLYMASLIGPENYGEVTFFLTVAGLATTISLFGASNSLLVLSSKNIKIQSTLYFIAIVGGTISSIAVFLIFYQAGASLLVLGFVIFGLVSYDLLGKKLFQNYLTIVISQKVLLIILAIGFYFLIGNDGILMGMALSSFPYAYYLIKTLKNEKINFQLIKEHFNFLIYNYFHSLTGILATSVDKIIIGPLFGFALLGNYALGMQFLTLLILLPKSVGKYIIPYDATGTQNKKLKLLLLLFSVCLSIFGIIMGPVLLSTFFPDFVESKIVIQIVSLIAISSAINMIYTSKFLAIEKSKYIFRGSILGLLVQILGILILGNLFQVNGIAFSAFLGSLCISIFFILTDRFSNHKNKIL